LVTKEKNTYLRKITSKDFRTDIRIGTYATSRALILSDGEAMGKIRKCSLMSTTVTSL
jgi:hypothetical protein